MREIFLKIGSVFSRVVAAIRAHKTLVAAGGVVVASGVTYGLVKRSQAAAVGEKLVAKIKEQLGTAYIWGGRSPNVGFDCSGIITFALRELGLEPKKWSENAVQMYHDASKVILPQAGDLVFYGPPFGDPDHVMMYMGENKVIGASGGGPKTKTIQDAKDRNAMVKILPLDYRKDRKSFGRLPVQEASTLVGSLHMLGSS